MKKISLLSPIIIATLFFFTSLSIVYPAESQFQFHISSDTIEISYHAPDISEEVLSASLAKGQTAGFTYEFRLFQETRGILSLLGDKMIAEKTVTCSVRYDEFCSAYVLTTSGTETFCSTFEEIMGKLKSVHVSFERKTNTASEHMYTRIRTTLVPRKLTAPFTLLEPFFNRDHVREGWKEFRFAPVSGSS